MVAVAICGGFVGKKLRDNKDAGAMKGSDNKEQE